MFVRSGGRMGSFRGHGHYYGDLWTYLHKGLPEGSVRFGVDIAEVRGGHTYVGPAIPV